MEFGRRNRKFEAQRIDVKCLILGITWRRSYQWGFPRI
jgi:hypothetical protein